MFMSFKAFVSFFLLFFRITNVTLAPGTEVRMQVEPLLYAQLISSGKSFFTYINESSVRQDVVDYF